MQNKNVTESPRMHGLASLGFESMPEGLSFYGIEGTVTFGLLQAILG